MSDALVETEITDQIAIVRLNRPVEYNSLNEPALKLFANIMISLAIDDQVRGLIITGNGKAFSGGGDLKSGISSKGGVSSYFYNIAHFLHVGILEIKRMPKPVISAINGVAAGGGFSLALACDFRIMAASAKLRQAYTSNGLSIDGGGTFTLPRLVGYAKAIEIAYLDPLITAEEALKMGLVNIIVPDNQLVDTALEFAKKGKSISLNSFGLTKRLLNESFTNTLEKQLELEREFLAQAAKDNDGLEGVNAFLEKRKPNF